MGVNKIGKYLKVYRTMFRHSFIQGTAYRASFLLQLGVELGYQVVFVIFFLVIFDNVKEIAGWDYHQVLFLSGLNAASSELIVGAFFVFGLWNLPAAIKDGDIDVALLKPINSLFNLSLARPYFASFVAAIPGFGLMAYAASQMEHQPSLGAVFLGTLLFLCGFVIAYAIAVIISSLSFYFLNSTALPRIADKVVFEYKTNPHDVYQGALRAILFFVVPAVFITSIPAAAMIRTVEPFLLLLAPVLATFLLWLAIVIWHRMIKHYSSASS